MSEQETPVFIGSAKVLTNTLENGVVTYTLDNGLTNIATLEQFTALCSPEAYDDGKISMRKWRPVIEGIINTLMQNNAEFGDTGWILDRVSESIAASANAATAKVLGVTARERVTLKRLDEILKTE